MEIQSLKIRVKHEDVNSFLRQLPRQKIPVEGLQARFSQKGVHITGSYPVMLLKVSFETVWELRAADGRIEAELTGLSLAGVPAGTFRRLLLQLIEDSLASQPGFTLEGETARIDFEEAMRARGIPAQGRVTRIQCEEGFLLLEAGS